MGDIRNRALLFGLAASLSALGLRASAKTDPIIGPTVSCVSWTASQAAPDNEKKGPQLLEGFERLKELAPFAYTVWVEGFLSGKVESAGPGNVVVATSLSEEEMVNWLDRYCLVHPVDDLEDAATAFYFKSGAFSFAKNKAASK